MTLDKGLENMIKIRGKRDLLIYFRWRCKGYVRGFMGDHRVIRLISKAALALTAILVAFMVLSSVPWNNPKDDKNNASVAQAAEELKTDPEPSERTEESVDREPEEQALEIKEEPESKPEPLNDSLVIPADVYTEKGHSADFMAYHTQAKDYQWEIYDTEAESWQKAPEESVVVRQDELLREISFLQLRSDQDQSIRCRIVTVNGPPITYEADLHVLSGKISSIAADEFSVQMGEYVSVKDIPVKVTYQDGTKDEITGLSGLYFLNQETTRDTTTESGNLKETITTIRTACEYEHVEEMGVQNGLLCYRPTSEEEAIDIPIAINGVDMTPPKITSLTVDGYEISNVVKTVPVTVAIQAVDEVTPNRKLEYAFLPAGVDIKKAKWMKDASFTAEIDKNGIWTAYVKDGNGNIASKEQDLVVIDDQPPEIELHLDNQSGWCSENQIYVSAEDALPVQYRYICETAGEDSGWIAESSKCIRKNGIWKIQVQDTLGNVAEQTITIENIDTQPPVIRSIQEKTEKELSNEE